MSHAGNGQIQYTISSIKAISKLV